MRGPYRRIEAFFGRRYDREALFLPSGRLALYLAFREWLRPGDRLLLSPVNDDVVFFTVLAADLVPVLGPVDAATGNLNPAAVDEATWRRLKGVLTTNLYGIPDRMDLLEEKCRTHGLLLVEDACQALDTRFAEQRIGQFSTVAAFSLTKHVEGVGGVLVFSESARREALERRAAQELRRRTMAQQVRLRGRHLAAALMGGTGTKETFSRLRRRFLSRPAERTGHRMPYRLDEVLQARDGGAGLDRFDRWVRVDNAAYRTVPLATSVRDTLRLLEAFEENRRLRLEGTRRLLELGLTPRDLPVAPGVALFRVPLFVENRERVLHDFARQGLDLDYVYDPPLDLYAAPELAERLSSGTAARSWSRDVLPVDPLRAERFLNLATRYPTLVPARPERVQ